MFISQQQCFSSFSPLKSLMLCRGGVLRFQAPVPTIPVHKPLFLSPSPRFRAQVFSPNFDYLRFFCNSTEREPKKRKSFLKNPDKDLITLTEGARGHIRSLMKSQNTSLRIDTKAGGCNGWRYVMEFVEEIPEGDEVVHDPSGIVISVAPKAVLAVVGTEMDYVSDSLKSEFVFKNPNASGECGCGESFNLVENPAFVSPKRIGKLK